MNARATAMVVFLCLLLLLTITGCEPTGRPREAAAPEATASGEPGTPAPTEESTYYPPPPTVTPAPTDPDTGYPVPPATPEGQPLPSPTWSPAPEMTPTEEPFPTPIPTPVVTPMPTAVAPFALEAEGRAPEPFTLVYRDGDTIRAVESDGEGDRLLLDPCELTGLHLAGQGVKVDSSEQGGPSPDGRYLALVLSDVERLEDLPKGQEPKLRIDLFDLETGEPRVLVENAVEPVWSRDGTHIVYRDLATGGLGLADVSSGGTSTLYVSESGGGQYATMMDWSPDGRSIVFVESVFRQSHQMIVVDLEKAHEPRVLVAADEGWPSYPRWSPKGDRIVYSDYEGESSSSIVFYSLWAIYPDGSSRDQLTRDIDVTQGAWSPDGLWIAFGGHPSYEPEASWDLWLLNPDGMELRRLAWSPEENETSPQWSPDGLNLVYERGIRGEPSSVEIWRLYLLDGSTTPLRAEVDGVSWWQVGQ